jgi:hypothetical protein
MGLRGIEERKAAGARLEAPTESFGVRFGNFAKTNDFGPFLSAYGTENSIEPNDPTVVLVVGMTNGADEAIADEILVDHRIVLTAQTMAKAAAME